MTHCTLTLPLPFAFRSLKVKVISFYEIPLYDYGIYRFSLDDDVILKLPDSNALQPQVMSYLLDQAF